MADDWNVGGCFLVRPTLRGEEDEEELQDDPVQETVGRKWHNHAVKPVHV